MRVITATAFGGPDVLLPTDVPAPVAEPGQAVIGVAVADVLFVETQIRAGLMGGHFSFAPPYVPGGGVAGEVRSVAPDVDPGWIGQRVAARTIAGGGYAEQAVASAESLVRVPDTLSLREAAALLHDGPTAMSLIDNAQIREREWVLITGAGGGMGSLLIQLARSAGARVIGAARGPRKLDEIRDRRADLAVDYAEADWVERVREATDGHGANVVLDGVGGQIGRAAFGLTARDGQFSAHGSPSGGFTEVAPAEADRRNVTVRGIDQVQFAPAEAKRMIVRAFEEATAGRMRPLIGQTFPLEKAADAHTAIEQRRAIGKTLLLTG